MTVNECIPLFVKPEMVFQENLGQQAISINLIDPKLARAIREANRLGLHGSEKMQKEDASPTFKVNADGQRAGKRPGLSALAPRRRRERRKQAALAYDYR